MTDVRKTLLGAMQRSSLFDKPKRTDWSGVASLAASALQTGDDDAWRRFCDQVLKELPSNVDLPTLKKLADDADKLRNEPKREARIEFAKRVIALATGEVPVAALEPQSVTSDAFAALERRKQEVTARLHGHRVELHKLEELDREIEKTRREYDEAETDLEGRRARLVELRRQLAEAEREWAMLQTVSGDEPTRNIGIIVGYLKYPAMTGPIPVYPVIVCEFPTATANGFKTELLDRLELAIDEDGRYKLFTPGNEDAPFAESDDPIGPDDHREFQRLSQHWGYWFLRVQGQLNQWDFQIIGGKVFALKRPIEDSLSVIERPRAEAIAAATQGSRHKDAKIVIAQAEKMVDRFEALVGKLPVKRQTTLKYDPDIVHAFVIQRGAKAAKATTQWVRLNVDKIEGQLKKILGGAFMSVVWSDVRSGTDFMQLMPKNDANCDVWLRAKRDRRPRSQLSQTVQVAGQNLPLEEFRTEDVESLQEGDVGSVVQFYQLPAERLRQVAPARIAATADTPSTEVDKDTHEAIIHNYLRLCQVIRIAAQGSDQNACRVWPLLRDAVIFEMPSAAYTTLHSEFFRYCVRSAKVDPDIPLSEHNARQRKRVMDVIGTGMDAPFPDKLPFRACFFAYGAGVRDVNSDLLEHELRKKETGAVPPSVGKLYGHLVTDAGIVVSFRHLDNANNGQEGIAFTFDRDPSSSKGQQWDRPHTMTPWIVNALVSYVNEHKRLVEQRPNGFAQQTLFKRTSKKLSMKPPIPPPFYIVFLKDEFIREQAQQRAASIKRHIDWQHRWNVRGHDCVRFMRGELPLDPELEQDLLARKYKVFTVEQPDAETFMALAKRGVPPKATNEWMAVLMYWRDSFVKGPEDKPLIESVRRSTKTWGES